MSDRKIRLFANTCVRLDDRGRLWLMNKPDNGWGEYGRLVASLEAVVEEYAVIVGPWFDDRHSRRANVYLAEE